MKTLFSLLFLGVVVFCAFKVVPVYVKNYELQDYLSQMAVEATVHQQRQTPEVLKNEIFAKAESLGLPVEHADIQVSVGPTVLIGVDYSVYVDLRFYMLPLHFTPSAQNSTI